MFSKILRHLNGKAPLLGIGLLNIHTFRAPLQTEQRSTPAYFAWRIQKGHKYQLDQKKMLKSILNTTMFETTQREGN